MSIAGDNGEPAPDRGPSTDGRGLLCALIFTMFGASCATADQLPQVSWEGEHIRFSTTVDHLPCGDSLAFMDRRVGELASALDEPLRAEEKISYYWLPDRMDLSPCPRAADCAEGLTVFSRTMFHDHEIVHVLLRRLGRSQTFLYEGMAEAFGRAGGELTIARDNVEEEFRRSLSGAVDPATIDYPLAGLFVRFLIETYGMAAVKDVYLRARPETVIDELGLLFEELLGRPLEDVLNAFVEEAPECYARPDLCAADPVPWDDGIWRHDFGLGCSSPGVLEISPGALRNDAVVELPETGEYGVTVSAPGTSGMPVVIIACACRATPHEVAPGAESTLTLEGGRYRVIAGRRALDFEEDVTPVAVTISF